MNVYWLEQRSSNVPEGDDWLCANEAARLSGLRFPKRRADWRLGRWTAKLAVAAYFDLSGHSAALAEMEIRPGLSGAPEVLFRDLPAGVTISLSHRAGRALCAVAPADVRLGCDLEVIEPRTDGFVGDYFTLEEQKMIARAPAAERALLVNLIWSAKESALKALQEGLRLDTRSVIVSADTSSSDVQGWRPLQVCYMETHLFHGWWRQCEDFLFTLATGRPVERPIALQVSSHIISSCV